MEQSIQNLDALLSTLENASRITDQRNACKNIQNWLFDERNKAALNTVAGELRFAFLFKQLSQHIR
jgi:hypothetical protein